MSIVSYAQNFEDVMLLRALNHVDRGFYIDVGAAWPDLHSVTRAFYERGWRGINIEPQPDFHSQLQEKRPNDTNLAVAVGDKPGFRLMNLVSDTGLSTLDNAIAERHKAAGFRVAHHRVRIVTLSSVWKQHVPNGQEVHFLKVDVEGFEKAVLCSNDWQRNRPWVIVVEATKPLLQEENHSEWESVLLESGYQRAYADGLNLFYIAHEHAHLLPSFRYPPNAFDDFVLAKELDAHSEARQAEARTQLAERRVDEALALGHQAEARAQLAERRVDEALALAHQAEARVRLAEVATAEAATRAQELEAMKGALQAQVEQLHGRAHLWWEQATHLETERNALIHSWSWRITAPLRLGLDLTVRPIVTLRKLANHALHRAIEIAQRPLAGAMSAVLRRPQLSYRINKFLMSYPALRQQLLSVAHRQNVLLDMPAHQSNRFSDSPQSSETELSNLSPRARQLYANLKAAIDKNRGSPSF